MQNFLYLIRHPAVLQDLSISAVQWSLSELGFHQSRELAKLDIWENTPVDIIYSSAELKAIQTAEVISEQHPHLKRRALMSLNEAKRSVGYLTEAEYQQCAHDFFSYPDKAAMPGWERSSAVRSLVVGTYEDILHDLKHQQKSAAIIGHGLALTLLRGHILGQPATYDDWRKLSLGSWAIVEVRTGQLAQDFQPISMPPNEPAEVTK